MDRHASAAAMSAVGRRGLYREVEPRAPRPITVKAVPYYAWGNRGDTDMSVWIPVR